MSGDLYRPSSRPDLQQLVAQARIASQSAYAPYSRFRVGAAVLTQNGLVVTAGNVENASYGLAICAERSAIVAAVAAEGPTMRLRAIAVVTAHEGPASPCGACRQVLAEFGPRALVVYHGETGMVETTVADLLPGAFSNDDLAEHPE